MIIVPGILVAVVTVIVLVYFFNRKIAGIEVLAPIVLSLLIGTAVKFTAQWAQTTDKEYWGTWVTSASYQEDWTSWEEVDDYCTRTVSDGKKGTKTERYKCGHHTEYTYHGPEWMVQFASGDFASVDANHYESLRNLFGNHVQSDGHHSDYHRASYRSGTGYLHTTKWPNTDVTFRPATVVKSWTNKVQAAEQSLFHFRKVSTEEKSRFQIRDYPALRDFYVHDAIIGPAGPIHGPPNDRLVRANAKLGPTKQVKMFIFVYKDQPLEAALVQQSYLQGGNKNEFILCVGTDGQNNVEWSYPVTWCENEDLKVRIRDLATDQKKLDLAKLVDGMVPMIEKDFNRKHFKEFNYLEVATPLWGQITSLVICIIANIGLGYWLVNNDFDSGDSLMEKLGKERIGRRRFNV